MSNGGWKRLHCKDVVASTYKRNRKRWSIFSKQNKRFCLFITAPIYFVSILLYTHMSLLCNRSIYTRNTNLAHLTLDYGIKNRIRRTRILVKETKWTNLAKKIKMKQSDHFFKMKSQSLDEMKRAFDRRLRTSVPQMSPVTLSSTLLDSHTILPSKTPPLPKTIRKVRKTTFFKRIFARTTESRWWNIFCFVNQQLCSSPSNNVTRKETRYEIETETQLMDPDNLMPADASSLCGLIAQSASVVDQFSFNTKDVINNHPNTRQVRVLITGIVSTPVGYRLAQVLMKQCNVTVLVGFDIVYPNTIKNRIQYQEQVAVLSKMSNEMYKPFFMGYTGLDPVQHPEFFIKNNGTIGTSDEVDLIRTFQPTHIVHMAYHNSDHAFDPKHHKHVINKNTPYTRLYDDGNRTKTNKTVLNDQFVKHNPTLFPIRNGMISMEQILAAIANKPVNERPHFIYASTSKASSSSPLSEHTTTKYKFDTSVHTRSRTMDEIIADHYYRHHGVYSLGIRIPVVYGPWEHPSSPIYQALRQVALNHTGSQVPQSVATTTDSNSSQTEASDVGDGEYDDTLVDMIHVNDVVDALIGAMQFRPQRFESTTGTVPMTLQLNATVHNVSIRTIKQVAREILQSQRSSANNYYTNSRKLLDRPITGTSGVSIFQSLLGSLPHMDWKDGLARTLDWHLDRAQRYGPPIARSMNVFTTNEREKERRMKVISNDNKNTFASALPVDTTNDVKPINRNRRRLTEVSNTINNGKATVMEKSGENVDSSGTSNTNISSDTESEVVPATISEANPNPSPESAVKATPPGEADKPAPENKESKVVPATSSEANPNPSPERAVNVTPPAEAGKPAPENNESEVVPAASSEANPNPSPESSVNVTPPGETDKPAPENNEAKVVPAIEADPNPSPESTVNVAPPAEVDKPATESSELKVVPASETYPNPSPESAVNVATPAEADKPNPENIESNAVPASEAKSNDVTVSSMCPPDDVLCNEGRLRLPCASECMIHKPSECISTVFDDVLLLSQSLSQQCNVVLYTQILNVEASTISVDAQEISSNSTNPTVVCNFLYINQDSALAQNMLDNRQQLGGIPENTTLSNNELIVNLNGQLTSRGWKLIFVKNPQQPMKTYETSLLKLSPGRFFSTSVKEAIFIEQNCKKPLLHDDVLFLSSQMSRPYREARIAPRSLSSDDSQVMLPPEPPRRAALLVSHLIYQSSNDTAPLPQSAQINSFEATNFMRHEAGEAAPLLAGETPQIQQQREFCERVGYYANPQESSLRHYDAPNMNFVLSKFASTRWVIHDLTNDDSRTQIRCPWYEEHNRWETNIDQLSLLYVIERMDVERRMEQKDLDDAERAVINDMTELKRKVSDTYEWTPLKPNNIPRHQYYSPYMHDAKVLPNDMEYVTDHVNKLTNTIHITNITEPRLFIRIVSDRFLSYERNEWDALRTVS
jgi:nucleoside-diphosphate-sugar epimerase